MKLLRSLLSGLIIIFLVMTISGMIAVRAVNSLVGDPNSPEGAKSTAVMSDVLREAIAMTVAAAMGDGSLGWRLSEAEVQEAVRARLRDQDMMVLTSELSGAFKILSSGDKVEPGQAVLRLGAVRDAAFGGVRDLVHRKVAALPVCTAQQGASMAASPPQGMPDCRSNDQAFNEAMVNQAFEGARGAIPDQVDLGEVMTNMQEQMKEQMEGQMGAAGNGTSWWDSLPDMGSILRLPLRLMWFLASWGFVALFGLILAVVLLNLDTWHAQFGRVGWAAIFGAGMPLVAATLAIHYLPAVLIKVEESSPSSESMARLMFELLMIPLKEVRTISLIITLIGVGGLLVALVGRIMTKAPQSSNRAA